VSDLPVPQGEPRDLELVECFRVAEALSLAVFATDSASSAALVVSATTALGAILGRMPAQFTLLHLDDLMGSDLCAHPQSGLVETELQHAQGHSVPVLVTVRKLDSERPIWIWLVFPREPSKRNMANLARELVHEVNNPLTSVVCRLDLVGRQLKDSIGDPDRSDESRQVAEDLGRHVAAAQHGAARVIALVREFAESVQHTSTAAEHVDVVLTLSEALVLLQPDLERVATIVREFQPVPVVLGHASKLEQVFSNLLQNALLAIEEASLPQDHRVRLTVSARAEWVVVSVEDTGVGMPESLAQRVFEPFVTTRAAAGGTGLGLFICREIVEACGGRIEVQSSLLTGTRFRVWLKAAQDPDASGSLPPGSHRRSKRV